MALSYKKIGDGYILRFSTGDDLLDQLQKFVEQEGVYSGWISGLGSVSKATVGYFNTKRQKFIFRSIKDPRELVSLSGNITKNEKNETIIHLHGVVTNSNNKATGGHVSKLVVSAMAEIYIQTFEQGLSRKFDPTIGLEGLDL